MLLVETKIVLVLSREIDRHVLQTAAGIRVPIAEARHVPLAAKEGESSRVGFSIILAFATSRDALRFS